MRFGDRSSLTYWLKVNSSQAVEETPTKADESLVSISNVSTSSTALDLPVALTDATIDAPLGAVSSAQADTGTPTDTPPVSKNVLPNAVTVTGAAAEESVRSDPVIIVTDVPTVEVKEEEQAEAPTGQILQAAEPAAVEVSAHVVKFVEDSTAATSGNADNSDSSVAEMISAGLLAKEGIVAESIAEHVSKIHDGAAPTPLHGHTTFAEHDIVVETSTSAAHQVQDTALLNDSEPTAIAHAVVPPTAVEASGHADNSTGEPEVPHPPVNVGPPTDDTTIGEQVKEPADVARVEPTMVTATPTTEVKAANDPGLAGESVEHGSIIETITPEEPAEDLPVSEAIESSGFNATTILVPISGPADVDDAPVHSQHGATMIDIAPAVSERSQPIMHAEELVPATDAVQDAPATASNEVAESADPVFGNVSAPPESGEDTAISKAPHGTESTPVELIPVDGVRVEDVKHAEKVTKDVAQSLAVQKEGSTVEQTLAPEPGRSAFLVSEQDEHSRKQPAAVVDSDLLSTNKSFGVVGEEKTVKTGAEETSSHNEIAIDGLAVEPPSNEKASIPAGEVEPEVTAVANAIESPYGVGVVAETAIGPEPDHTPAATPVQFSSDAQQNSYAKGVDEKLLVHEDAEFSSGEEPVNVGTVDIDSTVPAKDLMKQGLSYTQDEPMIEQPVVELSSTKFFEEEAGGTRVVEEADEEVVPSIDGAPVPEVPTEMILNHGIGETKVAEETPSTLEDHVTEDKPAVQWVLEPSVLDNTPTVHEDEIRLAAKEDTSSTQGEPLTEDQPTAEDASLNLPSLDEEVSAPLTETTEGLEVDAPIGQVEEGKIIQQRTSLVLLTRAASNRRRDPLNSGRKRYSHRCSNPTIVCRPE